MAACRDLGEALESFIADLGGDPENWVVNSAKKAKDGSIDPIHACVATHFLRLGPGRHRLERVRSLPPSDFVNYDLFVGPALYLSLGHRSLIGRLPRRATPERLEFLPLVRSGRSVLHLLLQELQPGRARKFNPLTSSPRVFHKARLCSCRR